MAHAAALLWVAGLGHLVQGNVDLHAMAWLLVGSIPGVLIGSQLSIKVPERSLRIAFSVVLFFINVIRSWHGGELAGNDPWHANTLEWATTSPPPPYNFERVPPVRSFMPPLP